MTSARSVGFDPTRCCSGDGPAGLRFTALPCRRGGSPRIGKRRVSTFAGVLLVEAAKQIYAKPAAVRASRRRLVYALAPHGL